MSPLVGVLAVALGFALAGWGRAARRARLAARPAWRPREPYRETPHADEFEAPPTFGQRVADRVAATGGSWPFVITFSVGMALYMVLQHVLGRAAFDPYPYILLNLVLSTLAAIQAPIIMMSANRQAARDGATRDRDYAVDVQSHEELKQLARGHAALLKNQAEIIAQLEALQHEE